MASGCSHTDANQHVYPYSNVAQLSHTYADTHTNTKPNTNIYPRAGLGYTFYFSPFDGPGHVVDLPGSSL